MIKINKKIIEPILLTKYRNMDGSTYKDMHGAYLGGNKDVYNVVLDALLEEQGHLCAYCMCKIPDKSGKARIEHIIPQSKEPDAALDYRNMLAVCYGNDASVIPEFKTCDARRGNRDLSLNPLNQSTLTSIKYKNDGRIFSDNEEVNKELNDILNLNCQARLLSSSRKQALDAMIGFIHKRKKNGSIKLLCERLLSKYQEYKIYKEPYVGILIYWLHRHV